MNREKKGLFALIIIGGFAVLASYVWGVLAHPGTAGLLWGNIPPKAIPYYTASMLLAALGFLVFTHYLLLSLDLGREKINLPRGYRSFLVLYGLILIPSALWVPLIYWMLDHPGDLVWLAIRLVLFLVGLGALGMMSALLNIQPRSPRLLAAVIGCIFFCIQTVLLDAFVWPNYFLLGL